MKMIRHIPRALFAFLLDYPEEVRDLFEATRNLVLDVHEDVYELIWDNYNALAVAYSTSEKLRDAYCHIAAYSTYVNLGFNQGVHLPDPKGLLQGTGKLIRHVQIKGEDRLDSDVRRLIYESRQWSRQLNPLTPELTGTQSVVMSISEQRRRPKI